MPMWLIIFGLILHLKPVIRKIPKSMSSPISKLIFHQRLFFGDKNSWKVGWDVAHEN